MALAKEELPRISKSVVAENPARTDDTWNQRPFTSLNVPTLTAAVVLGKTASVVLAKLIVSPGPDREALRVRLVPEEPVV